MIGTRSVFFLLLVLFSSPAWAVIPGGVYPSGDSINITLDPSLLPHTTGYHLVRGSVIYHGRKTPFCSGCFFTAGVLSHPGSDADRDDAA